MEDNITVGLKEGLWSTLIWLQIGSTGGHLWTWQRTLRFKKWQTIAQLIGYWVLRRTAPWFIRWLADLLVYGKTCEFGHSFTCSTMLADRKSSVVSVSYCTWTGIPIH